MDLDIITKVTQHYSTIHLPLAVFVAFFYLVIPMVALPSSVQQLSSMEKFPSHIINHHTEDDEGNLDSGKPQGGLNSLLPLGGKPQSDPLELNLVPEVNVRVQNSKNKK